MLQVCTLARAPSKGEAERVTTLEIANVFFHPRPRLFAALELDRRGDSMLRLGDSRTRLRHTIDQLGERRREQQIERRLRQGKHLVAACHGNCRKEIDDPCDGRLRVVGVALEACAGSEQRLQLSGRAAGRSMLCSCGFDRHHRFPQFEKSDVVQSQRAAHTRS